MLRKGSRGVCFEVTGYPHPVPEACVFQDRENSEFLAAKIALADPSNRVRSDMTQTRREDNVNQLVGMWGNDPEPPMNDAVCVHVCAFVCVLCVCVRVCCVYM